MYEEYVIMKVYLQLHDMLEKEIKILEIDTSLVVKKLLELWAEKTFDGDIRDTYYDFIERAHCKREECERIFRLREKWDKNIYTIKEKRQLLSDEEKVVVKEEHEVEVTDAWAFSKTLTMQGMIPIRKKEKHRISFKHEGVVFDIDTYKWIPTFLEIEGPSWEVIFKWVKKLFLDKQEQLVWWSRMVFDRYDIPYIYCD